MFEILTPTAAKLTSVTPRTEKHGDDDVFAVSLGLLIVGPNTLLDAIDPTLRLALYGPATDDIDELPGVEPATPILRTRAIDSLKLKAAFEGWTLTIDHGIDEADPITIGGAKVDKFVVEPMQGGSCELRFRVGSNDIDAAEAGQICAHLAQEISITLKAPEKPADVIDGTTGHPGAAAAQDGQASLLDTDAQGTPEGALAGALDPDDQAEDDTDGGAPDAAAFEAGAAQAIKAAGVRPARGRRLQ